MAKEALTCSSCGSALAASTTICDVCGHDTREDTVREDAQRESTLAAAPPSVAGQQTRKPARKTGKKPAAAAAAALFNTPQWIAIVVAAFILGGVVGASLVPTHDHGDAAMATQGTPPEAQADLTRLNETRAAAEANPDSPDALLAYAHALHDSGFPEQAIVQYRQYLAFVPDNPDARVDLGICYFETKDYTTAIAEMEKAVAGHPDHQLGNYNLGIVNLNAGNKEKAREWFEKARDINPSSPHGVNAAQLLEEQF